MAEAVGQLTAQAEADDRTYAMSLAMIREAGKKTQVDIAHELGITQGAVSRLENRGDVLLSTLRSYLTATGATHPRITVTVDGHDIELDLELLQSH